jgi:undecaprenyl-diphosphatase
VDPAGRGGRLGAAYPDLAQARLRPALTDGRADPVLLALARLRRPGLDRVVAAYSRLGNSGHGWVVLGVVLALALGRPSRAVAFAALVYGTLGLNFAVKHVVRRERPPLGGPVAPLIQAPASPSFPSSHAAMSAAAAFGLSELVPEAWPLFATLAVLMALSRLYLAVHYPIDVLAGAVLGTAVGAAYLLLGG